MVDFAEKKHIEAEPPRPKKCMVEFCDEPCCVYFPSKGIARCAFHYQQDVDRYTGKRRSASHFVHQKGLSL